MATLPLSPRKKNQNLSLAPQSEDGKRVSEAVYWAEYYRHEQFKYEWNDGVLEEVPVSNYVQYTLYRWFVALMGYYFVTHPIGRMVALEMGFRLQRPGGKVSIRKPDLGIVLDINPVPLDDHDMTYNGAFDLCVESISSSTEREVLRDTVVKKAEYAHAGVPEYFILDPSGEHTAFYSLARRGDYERIRPIDGIIRSRILPGFQFRVADLYTLPTPIELASDDVYSEFVLPEYQALQRLAQRADERAAQAELAAAAARIRAERAYSLAALESKRAEQETQRANQAAQRAEQETQRANQEAQRAEQEARRAEQVALRADSLKQENAQLRALLQSKGLLNE